MKTRVLPSATDLHATERAAICNGIGPRAGAGIFSKLFCGLLRIFIRLSGLAVLFDLCGDDHDLWYVLGGTEDDRDFADVVFFGACRAIKRKAPWPLHPLINLYSTASYDAVQAGGGFGPFTYRDASLSLGELRELRKSG